MSATRLKASDSKITIKIPGSLYNRIAKIVSGSGFHSVTEFILYVLRDLVSTQEERKVESTKPENGLSKEEIEAIRKRLKSLGYL